MKKLFTILISSILFAASLFAEEYTIKVSSPNGAPALALASLAQKNPENYTYVAADTIAAEFASGKADFIIAPINAGAKLYKMGKSSYKPTYLTLVKDLLLIVVFPLAVSVVMPNLKPLSKLLEV